MPALLDPAALHPDTALPDRAVAPLGPRNAPARPGGVPFVLVGGLPGAGKTTLLRRAAIRIPRLRVLDPERHRDRFAGLAGGRLPYRSYRPLVHGLHAAQVLGRLLAGPGDGRPLVVHEPATRPRRNAALAALARARGWRPVLLVLDVDPEQALAGQQARGRVLRTGSFRGHCERWGSGGWDAGRWDAVRLVRRDRAEEALRALLRRD
jgi:hypothetical protein